MTCVNVILDLDFQSQHQSITLSLGGSKPPLIIGLAALDVPPSLFENLNDNCCPIATKSRKYSYPDQ